MSLLGNRTVVAVPSLTLSKSCAIEPYLEISGRPLPPFLRLIHLWERKQGERSEATVLGRPLRPGPVWTASLSLGLGLWLHPGSPSESRGCPRKPVAFPAFKSPLESGTGCLQKRRLDLQPWGLIKLGCFVAVTVEKHWPFFFFSKGSRSVGPLGKSSGQGLLSAECNPRSAPHL